MPSPAYYMRVRLAKQSILFAVIAAFAIALDRLTKFLVYGKLRADDTIAIIPGVFHITHIHNKGAAFGLFQNQLYLFIGISVFVLVMIAVLYKEIVASKLTLIGTALILGGTIGNLIDRVYYGFVIDFIDFQIWPVFNLADMVLCAGVTLLIIFFVLSQKKEKHNYFERF